MVAESANFLRRSSIQLDGARAARLNVFQYHDLPAGHYEVRAVLLDSDGGRKEPVVAKMTIAS